MALFLFTGTLIGILSPRVEAVDSDSQTWYRAADCDDTAHYSARYAIDRRRMATLPAGSLAIRRLPKA